MRRIPDLNPKKNQGQATFFDTWRFHAFFTTTPHAERDTVEADNLEHLVRRGRTEFVYPLGALLRLFGVGSRFGRAGRRQLAGLARGARWRICWLHPS